MEDVFLNQIIRGGIINDEQLVLDPKLSLIIISLCNKYSVDLFYEDLDTEYIYTLLF